MDLSSITASQNTVEIRHPKTQEPIGLSITLRPATCDQVQAVKRKVTNENLRMRGKSLTAEKLEANGIEMLVAAIETWTWGKDVSGEEASWGGEKLEPTPANIRKVLREAPWIKSQVDDAFGDEAAFFVS